MIPGEIIPLDDEIELNAGKAAISLSVANSGDRPVQVGSHTHFFEVNRALVFNREAAYGTRLDIPSGTCVRFEPGQTHEVNLVAIGGLGIVYGFNRLVEGELSDQSIKSKAMEAVRRFREHRP